MNDVDYLSFSTTYFRFFGIRNVVHVDVKFNGHGFIGYPKGRNFERALGPSCPCVLCIPIHIITINIESFLGCHISHSLGLYLLHQI